MAKRFASLVLLSFGLMFGCGGTGGTGGGNLTIAPTITSGPSNQTVTAGQTATFMVAAAGTAPFTYVWARDGAAVAGAISSGYTTPATTLTDNGSKFTVTVSNSAGSATSSAATLTVNAASNAPTITIQPSNQTVAVGQAATFSVAAAGTSPLSYQWKKGVTTIPGAVAASYTTPATAIGDSGSQFTVTVSNVAGNVTSNVATLTVTAAAIAPTIAISPSSATLALGGTQNFTLTVTGTPAPTVNCPLQGPGTATVSGTTVTYAITAAQVPASWSAGISCTATNPAGASSPAAASITLNYPVPTLTSVIASSAFCSHECIVVNTSYKGSGFYPGGIVHTSPFFVDLTLAPGTDPNELLLNTPFGQDVWSPGPFTSTVDSPPGHGGGTSNPGIFNFLGNQNELLLSSTQAVGLNQGTPPGNANVFDLASGDHLQDFSVNIGGLVYSIAQDDNTGRVVTVQSGGQDTIIYSSSGAFIADLKTPLQSSMGVSAKSGFGCIAQMDANQLACIDLSQSNPTFVPTAIAGAPWNVQMTQVGGKLGCVVQTVGTPGITLVNVPSGQVAGSVSFTGLTSGSETGPNLGSLGITGGWWLAVQDSGIAAVLSRADKAVVFTDLGTMKVTGQATLTGDPFRIVADNLHNTFIVALADEATGGTNFVKVDPATGTVTPLNSKSTFLAGGLATDGTKIYVYMRGQLQSLPNN